MAARGKSESAGLTRGESASSGVPAADAKRDPDFEPLSPHPYLYVSEALLKGGAERLRKQEFQCAAALNPY
jgi:hypothetical protein